MSGAICGYINFDDNKALVDIGNLMIEKLKNYKLDKINQIYMNNVFMACGLLNIDEYFNKEDLPYYNRDEKIIITADASIFNRKELQTKLCNNKNIYEMTDSEIIIEAYKKWNEECPKYLIGDFAFVIWDMNKKSLFAARDHTGNRTLYYRYDKDRISFSTIENSIVAIYEENKLNEEWITEYLAIPGVVQQLTPNITVFEKIYQLLPGSVMTVKDNKLEIKKYWEPLKNIKPLVLKNNDEYKKVFREIFFEAVNCRIKTNKNVGIMVSGGLDSGSVASVAAIELNKYGKRLKGYCSIPIKEYENNNLSGYFITDESEYVQELAKKYTNIDLNFLRCEGKDAITDVEKIIEILEQPYKIFKNIVWINEIYKRSSSDGCKVLLDAQYGNTTISYGDINTNLKTLFSKGKILTLINEINHICKMYGLKKSYALREVIKILLPFKLKIMMKKNIYNFDESFLKEELYHKWKIVDKFENNNYYGNIEKYSTLKENNLFKISDVKFTQIGLIDTKLSLYNGIVIRDPCKDKRLIEFCLSIPNDQYVKNGIERCLVRNYLEGILPDKIRLNIKHRGIQSADWIQRLEGKEKIIEEEIMDKTNIESLEKYLKINELNKEFTHNLNMKDEDNKVSLYISILILLKFIKKYRTQIK